MANSSDANEISISAQVSILFEMRERKFRDMRTLTLQTIISN